MFIEQTFKLSYLDLFVYIGLSVTAYQSLVILVFFIIKGSMGSFCLPFSNICIYIFSHFFPLCNRICGRRAFSTRVSAAAGAVLRCM